MATITQVTRTKVQTHVNISTSQELVQTMLSASFGCVTYLRGIFPDDTFCEQRYNVNQATQKSGQPGGQSADASQRLMLIQRDCSPEATELLDYLEHGVFDALDKRYLQSVVLSISLDKSNENNVHECYTFQISYSEGKLPSLLVQDNKRGMSTASLPLDAAKRSMSQLFRQLIMMTQSLAPLPESVDRLLSIRLFFTDTTPDSYQPPGFRASTVNDAAKFVTRFQHERPHDQEIGSINTGFHACTLKIATIGDADLSSQDRKTPLVRFWDAEHHAKTTCDATDFAVEYVKSTLQIPPPFEIEALYPESEAMDCDRHEPEGESYQATQVMTQPESQKVKPCRRLDATESGLEGGYLGQMQDTRRTRSRTKLDTLARAGDQPATEQTHTATLPLQGLVDRTNKQVAVTARGDTSHKSLADIVGCECGDLTDEGLMVQCERCRTWSHCSCYGFKDTPGEGYVHACYSCQEPSLEDLEDFRSLVIMRRSLYILWDNGYCFTSTKDFGKAIGVADFRTVNGVIHRLLKDNWICASKKRTGKNKSRSAYDVIKTPGNQKRLLSEIFNPQRFSCRTHGAFDEKTVNTGVLTTVQVVESQITKHDNTDQSTGVLSAKDVNALALEPTSVDIARAGSFVPASNFVRKDPSIIPCENISDKSQEVGSISNIAPAMSMRQYINDESDTTNDEEEDEDLDARPQSLAPKRKRGLSAVTPAPSTTLAKRKRMKMSIIKHPIVVGDFETHGQ